MEQVTTNPLSDYGTPTASAFRSTDAADGISLNGYNYVLSAMNGGGFHAKRTLLNTKQDLSFTSQPKLFDIRSVDFERSYNEDYRYMEKECPNYFTLYYAKASFTKAFDDPEFEKEAFIENVEVYIQDWGQQEAPQEDDVAWVFTHRKDEDGQPKVVIDKQEGKALYERLKFVPMDIDLCLNDAIRILMKSDMRKPAKDVVVLARPFDTEYGEKPLPWYIFGDQNDSVVLDLNDMTLRDGGKKKQP